MAGETDLPPSLLMAIEKGRLAMSPAKTDPTLGVNSLILLLSEFCGVKGICETTNTKAANPQTRTIQEAAEFFEIVNLTRKIGFRFHRAF
ncbi:MAG: hypothetical protein WCD79_06565 [Chthoniobacteraceae bacterium]